MKVTDQYIYYQGLCFAESLNLSAFVTGKIILFGKVKRAQIALGAHADKLTKRMMDFNKLTACTGVFVFERNIVREVNNSEIIIGDIIVEFESKPGASVDDLHK